MRLSWVLACCSLWACAVDVRAFTAEQMLDLEPGALRQFGADVDPANDVLPEESEIDRLVSLEKLKQMAAETARLQQQQRQEALLMQQQEKERQKQQFTYRFPEAPPSRFALRPADPGYYATSLAADVDSGEMQAGSDITLRQDSPLLQVDVSPLRFHLQPPPAAPLPALNGGASGGQGERQLTAPPKQLLEPEEPQVWQKQPLPPEQEPQQLQQQQPDVRTRPLPPADDGSDLYFIAIVAGCSAAAIVGIIAIGISWYRLQKNAKAAADVEYPAYGVTGPNKEPSPTGDRRLAQSAQMYHYQHQKQQIIAMESRTGANERPGSVSEAESDEEGEEGDYTVYECPGLAPTGEMEVKNPLFQDEPTPATPAPKAASAPAAPAAPTDQPQDPPPQQKKQP
ncbi:protein cab-1 isoform X1 [Schistocerca nitens]|uniref:protein cab-1 isoform X1 n=1 Tax=Schistocerca nitens TaxID=7011 RepID=UPI002117D56A|nr:protein cab-1 isoform X1 [Schistocerca nitens]